MNKRTLKLKRTVAKVAHYGVEVYVNKFFKDNGLHRRIAEFDDNVIEYWDTESDLPPFLLVHGFGAEAKYLGLVLGVNNKYEACFYLKVMKNIVLQICLNS